MRIRFGRQRQRSDEMFDTSRMLTLSDGVFAIAATLLVLNLQPKLYCPAHESCTTSAILGNMIVAYWSYVLSFVIISTYWIVHHRLFRLIQRGNPTLAWLNLLFLLFIAIIPFPTSLLASSTSNDRLAPVVYAAVLACVGLSLTAIWLYTTHERDSSRQTWIARPFFRRRSRVHPPPVCSSSPYQSPCSSAPPPVNSSGCSSPSRRFFCDVSPLRRRTETLHGPCSDSKTRSPLKYLQRQAREPKTRLHRDAIGPLTGR